MRSETFVEEALSIFLHFCLLSLATFIVSHWA